MDSSYFGEPNMGNERGGGSSRKGKKSNSEKPKQPQRGLGVAQLEKIRLQGQYGCNYHPSIHGPYPPPFNPDDPRMQTAYPSLPSSTFSYSSSSSSSTSYGFHPGFMMGVGEYERTDVRYSDPQSTAGASWDPSKGILEAQHYPQPSMTRPFLGSNIEDPEQRRGRNHRNNSLGSSSQNSDSSDTQEIDLELRLSL